MEDGGRSRLKSRDREAVVVLGSTAADVGEPKNTLRKSRSGKQLGMRKAVPFRISAKRRNPVALANLMVCPRPALSLLIKGGNDIGCRSAASGGRLGVQSRNEVL
jgi:hypothetical protein